ncbi:L-threonylcarbamoyladenylate synthase [Chlamydiota bacterium]
MAAKIVSVSQDEKGLEIIRTAAKLLCRGKLIAFPTETVYGVGVNLLDIQAQERLYRIKKRSKNKPLQLLLPDVDAIKNYVKNKPQIFTIIKRFSPGPITYIIISDCGYFSGQKIGIRIPDNAITQQLLRYAKVPVGGTSANKSGAKSPLCARDVAQELGDYIDLILDGGRVSIGVDSTVLDLTASSPRILREGPVKKDDIFSVFS